MSRKTAILIVAALYAFGLLASFGPPAVDAAVSATVFGF